MINVKEFIYNNLKNDTTLSSYVDDRIYPNVAPLGSELPLIVFNRITKGKIDLKGIRNEYFQISVWGEIVNDNETIMGVISSIFHGLKISPIKFCNVIGFNESFDKEIGAFGNHTDIHLKIFET